MSSTNVPRECSQRLRDAENMNSNLRTPADRYIAINDAIRAVFNFDQKDPSVLGTSRAASLFNAAQFARHAYGMHSSGEVVTDAKHIESYFSDVPRPYFLAELDKSKIVNLINLYGPDVMRANIISANLVESDHLPLVTGGACILETWSTRLLNKPILKNNPGLRREVLLFLLQNAPYYSHVTGTMIPGPKDGISIMYDETFPWFLTIFELGKTPEISHNKWNLGITEEICKGFYDEIYSVTQRRATMVADNGIQILRLPFSDLRLERDGYLKSWFSEYSAHVPPDCKEFLPKNYDKDGFLGAYVRYTYVGPQILKIVKERMADVGVDLSKFDIHVRTKQEDHLYEGKRVNRMLLQGIKSEDNGFLKKYANICNLAIYYWHMQNWNRNSNGFIGFTDLSFKGNIVHDTINLATGNNNDPKNEEELWDLLNSSLRLHKCNVDEHLECLDKYVDGVYIYEEIASQVIGLEEKIKKLKKKLENISFHAKQRTIIRNILNNLACENDNWPTKIAELNHSIAKEGFINGEVVEELQKQINLLGKRYGARPDVVKVPCSNELFRTMENELVIELDGEVILISLQNSDRYCNLLKVLANELNNEVTNYHLKASAEKLTLVQLQVEDAQVIKQVHDVPFHHIDLSITKPNLFPLRDNMVFCHSIQFSFDPNIGSFIIDAQKIEAGNLTMDEKRRQLIRAMDQILPTIKAYLRSIMTNTDQAAAHHNTKEYEPVSRQGESI